MTRLPDSTGSGESNSPLIFHLSMLLLVFISSCSSLPFSSGRVAGALRDFHSPDPAVRDLAEVSLRRMGDDAVPPLLELVRRGSEDERYRAVRILGRIGPGAAEAVPDLIALLTGAELEIPSALATALAGIGAPAEPALLPLLGSPDDTVRYWAVVALGRMDSPGPPALAGLIRALDDPSDAVAAAADILLVTQGRRAVPALMAAADTDDDDAGVRLADILARIHRVEPGVDEDPVPPVPAPSADPVAPGEPVIPVGAAETATGMADPVPAAVPNPAASPPSDPMPANHPQR